MVKIPVLNIHCQELLQFVSDLICVVIPTEMAEGGKFKKILTENNIFKLLLKVLYHFNQTISWTK